MLIGWDEEVFGPSNVVNKVSALNWRVNGTAREELEEGNVKAWVADNIDLPIMERDRSSSRVGFNVRTNTL